mgnify:CR=1 FL=1
MKKLGQALNKFANGVAWVSFVGVAFLMLLNVADGVMNKLTGQSILGAYEISQSTLMCTVFASFAYGQVHKTHIHMTLLIERFPGRSKFIPFLGNLLSTVLAGIMTYATFFRANRQLTNGAVSDILHYSVAPLYYIEAVCMIVFMIVLLYDTILSLMAIFKGECAQEISSHW